MALTSTEEALVRQLLDQQAAILSLAGSESTIISKLGATKVTIADLTSASVIDDADLFLIRQGTSEKSVAGSVVKALASASIAGATTTSAGIVELATNAEVQTGTDPDRAITPSGLSSRTATETRTGVVELATDAEAQAFTADKFIDGAKLATALKGANQSLTANGYQKLPGGLIIQWGTASITTSSGGLPGGANTSGGKVTVTFPVTFTNSCLCGVATQNNTVGLNGGFIPYFSPTSSSQAQISLDDATTSGHGTYSVYWVAFGY